MRNLTFPIKLFSHKIELIILVSAAVKHYNVKILRGMGLGGIAQC
jgi:hypothetical protein